MVAVVVVVVVFAVAIIVVAIIVAVAVVDVQANKSLFVSSLPPRMVSVVKLQQKLWIWEQK